MAVAKDRVVERQAEIFKAIAHPVRLKIVQYLGYYGEQAVSDIVKAVGAEQSSVSRHLSLFKQAGVMQWRKQGLKVYYRLANPELAECIERIGTCVRGMVNGQLEPGDSMPAEAGAPPGMGRAVSGV